MLINGLYIAIGAFFGAISRFVVSKKVKHKIHSKFPFGTILVNLLGSFLLGLLFSLKMNDSISLLLGTGFMGSFTTFSTFQVESLKLGLEKEWSLLSKYLLLSYVLGITSAFMGFIVGKQF
ncbi:fluoride efflux transporter CrcB [Mycoplasmatota bacterium]|nr:fluoride efflux transporter CrcB [Mycoplasmatota bacterium]